MILIHRNESNIIYFFFFLDKNVKIIKRGLTPFEQVVQRDIIPVEDKLVHYRIVVEANVTVHGARLIISTRRRLIEAATGRLAAVSPIYPHARAINNFMQRCYYDTAPPITPTPLQNARVTNSSRGETSRGQL